MKLGLWAHEQLVARSFIPTAHHPMVAAPELHRPAAIALNPRHPGTKSTAVSSPPSPSTLILGRCFSCITIATKKMSDVAFATAVCSFCYCRM